MAGSELESSAGGGLRKERARALNATYDGLAVHQTPNGDIGVGAGVDEKTLRYAQRQPTNSQEAVLIRRIAYGASAINVSSSIIFGMMQDTHPSILGLGLGLATAGLTRLTSIAENRRRKAPAELTEKLTYIPSKNISTKIDSLPEGILVPHANIATPELTSVLRRLQTSHLAPENAANYLSEYPETVNPAMVVKGALLNLEHANREPFLCTVFDNATDLNRLTESLDKHAALAVTKQGREGLRAQTTELLSRLGSVAAAFVDHKSAQALPRIEALIDVADDANLRAGLEEARDEMQRPGLRVKRYELATENWAPAT